MAWTTYHKDVTATVGSDSYTLPTGNLELMNDPVSKAGSFALQRINSSFKQRIDGWMVLARFDYSELSGGVDADIRSMVEAALNSTTGIITVNFDPLNEYPAEDRTIDFILKAAPNAVVATFEGRARKRRSNFEMISRRQFTAPIEWITSNS